MYLLISLIISSPKIYRRSSSCFIYVVRSSTGLRIISTLPLMGKKFEMYILFYIALHFPSSFWYGGYRDWSNFFEFLVCFHCLLPSSATSFLSKYSWHLAGLLVSCFSVGGLRENLLTSTPVVWNTSTKWSSSWPPWRSVGRPTSTTHSLLVYCSWSDSRSSISIFAFRNVVGVKTHRVGFPLPYFSLQVFSLGCQLLSLNVRLLWICFKIF